MGNWVDYIVHNASWIFSGVGVLGISGLVWFFKSHTNKPANNQSQNIQGGSTGYQAARDININKKPKND